MVGMVWTMHMVQAKDVHVPITKPSLQTLKVKRGCGCLFFATNPPPLSKSSEVTLVLETCLRTTRSEIDVNHSPVLAYRYLTGPPGPRRKQITGSWLFVKLEGLDFPAAREKSNPRKSRRCFTDCTGGEVFS